MGIIDGHRFGPPTHPPKTSGTNEDGNLAIRECKGRRRNPRASADLPVEIVYDDLAWQCCRERL